MTNTIYLITGASRGIGRGLAEIFLARPNTIVIAAVRDPADSKSSTDPTAAVETLQKKHGIDHLDVVIANAGISEDFSTVHRLSVPVLQGHVEVNGYGPIYLYQAVYPLLKKSTKPTFVGIGSPLGSIGGMEQRPYPCAAYGPSKAILHWIVRKIYFENEEFVSFVTDPGFVQTDMGNAGAQAAGLEKAFQTVEEIVGGIVKSIDEGTRESVGAQLRVWDGSQFPW
ncbi:uncharacterized protein N7529_004561 [Penicillium soppii]|uniref:uncharacterized protein n=1 Tax=Penicillium soppii TaxID=69789 RepID=UPI0025484E6C|nr:uncharacterized protein N7529_004561 [Penicillium soppii]KAJ5872208.1 hypothetical protein N7529_004561 [Penicillium soppii]